MCNLIQRWNFPSSNHAGYSGIAHPGIETFKGTPIKSLAREICQNSLDAALKNGKPSRIEFKTFEISPEDIPDYNNLKDALVRGLDLCSLQRSTRDQDFFRQALAVMENPTITCLRISDFNTSGLLGSREEYNSHWCNLIKSSGVSDKCGSHGGSFGIGKFAPYACSALRTIFYSTCDQNQLSASQGVSRLASFMVQENELTQGIGFYGNEKNTPMYEYYSLDPTYSRNSKNSGTDIFITAFNADKEWQNKMIASILDSFLYAIYNESLVVDVDGTIISKNTLANLMTSHKDHFKEYADEYYQVLTNESLTRTFIKEFTDDSEIAGKLTLKLMIMPSFSRHVAMIRQTGMKIEDKNRISSVIPFAGTLFIEGDAINSYLRSLENPQHLKWEVERAENQNKAKNLLASMKAFIKDSLNEMKNDENEEIIVPVVGKYLATRDLDELSNQEHAETLQDNIKKIEIRATESIQSLSKIHTGESGRTPVFDKKGDIIVSNSPDKNGNNGNQSKKGYHRNDGSNNSADGGRDKKASVISVASVRNIVRNKLTGEYTIVFTPDSSSTNGVLEVLMSAESERYAASIISASCSECPDLECKKNRITNLIFIKGKSIRLNIQLDYHEYCSLEVMAYGN